jgi:hypothetical protein
MNDCRDCRNCNVEKQEGVVWIRRSFQTGKRMGVASYNQRRFWSAWVSLVGGFAAVVRCMSCRAQPPASAGSYYCASDRCLP